MRTVLTNEMIDRAALTVPLSDEHYNGLLKFLEQHLGLYLGVVKQALGDFLSQATYAEIARHDAVHMLKEKLVCMVGEADMLRAARLAEVMTCVKASTPVCQHCASLTVEYTIDSRWKIVRAGQRCPNLVCRQVIMWQPPPLYHFNWFAKTWVPKTQRFDESSGYQVPIGEDEVAAFLSGVGGVHPVISELLSRQSLSLLQLLSALKIKAPSDVEEAAQRLWSISGKYFGFPPYLYSDALLDQAVHRAKKIEPPVWEGNTTVAPELYIPPAAVPEFIPVKKTQEEHNLVRQLENRRVALANPETRIKVYSKLLSMGAAEFEGVLRSLNLAQAGLLRVQGKRELELINFCERRCSFGDLFDTVMKAG